MKEHSTLRRMMSVLKLDGRQMAKDGVKTKKSLPQMAARPRKSALTLRTSLSRSPLPYLPPELWLLIIRYATEPEAGALAPYDALPYTCASSFSSYTSTSSSFIPSSSTSLIPSSSSATSLTTTATTTSTSEPISFLAFPHSHSHLQQRQESYNRAIRYKACLRRVCKLWNEVAQEVLYEFVWISRAMEARRLAGALVRYQNGGAGAGGNVSGWENNSPGRHIRRLHIETPNLDRCSPFDLRIILDHAPRLTVYSDYRSIRRLSPFSDPPDPRLSPSQLLGALVQGSSLKRLSWTNYEYDLGDFVGGVSFYKRVVSPMLQMTAAQLEFLELDFCATANFGQTTSRLGDEGKAMEELVTQALNGAGLVLPALRSLKVTLDNATFAVLATWSMPLLQNLSVLSADFSYAGTGFAQFFLIHGPKLVQLELGHSSGAIEEHYLTAPPTAAGGALGRIPLADWCPNLREFICSADAEWNWQSPDWIAPHVLLPTHPMLQFIGIRDVEKRLLDDMRLSDDRLREGGVDGEEEEDPFFMLEEQVGSLLRREAFPALLYVRDMSWGSDVMRRTGRMCVGKDGEFSAVPPMLPTISLPAGGISAFASTSAALKGAFGREDKEARKRRQEMIEAEERASVAGRKVLRFWWRVLDRCKERGVWLEDCRGVNVTVSDLRRAEVAGAR